MFRENSIKTCILSRVKQITSPAWMHETSARDWCTGKTQRMGWRGRWEGGSGWGIHVTPWLIHVNVWQKPLQYCKVISLQLIKINEKKTKLTFNKILIKNTSVFSDYQFHVIQLWLFQFLRKLSILIWFSHYRHKESYTYLLFLQVAHLWCYSTLCKSFCLFF